MGQECIRSTSITNGQNAIDMSELVPGVYFYVIEDGFGLVKTEKLIVK